MIQKPVLNFQQLVIYLIKNHFYYSGAHFLLNLIKTHVFTLKFKIIIKFHFDNQFYFL